MKIEIDIDLEPIKEKARKQIENRIKKQISLITLPDIDFPDIEARLTKIEEYINDQKRGWDN